LRNQYVDAVGARDQAAQEGDIDNFDWHDRQAEALEQEYAQIAPPPQGTQLSEKKLKYIADRWDLDLMGTPEKMQLAGNAHDYVVHRCGITDDSPEYFDAMSVYLEKPGYQRPPSPDDVVKMLGIDAKTYNEGVNRLARLKQSGAIRDK